LITYHFIPDEDKWHAIGKYCVAISWDLTN